MKGKHGFAFNAQDRSLFLKECEALLRPLMEGVDAVVIPETCNAFLIDLAQGLGTPVVELKKRSVESVIGLLDAQQMMKAEREKLYQSLAGMSVVKINGVAGNQRKRFEAALFEPIALRAGANIMLLDDAVFGGSTMAAAARALGREPDQAIALFSKM